MTDIDSKRWDLVTAISKKIDDNGGLLRRDSLFSDEALKQLRDSIGDKKDFWKVCALIRSETRSSSGRYDSLKQLRDSLGDEKPFWKVCALPSKVS